MQNATSSRGQKLAPIQANTLYPLTVFEQVSGLGKHAMRQARKQGLSVMHIGGRSFVDGSEFINFVREHAGSKARTQ